MLKFDIKSTFSGNLDMESVFGDQPLEMQCPGCEYQFTVKFKDVMKEGNQVICPGCNEPIQIKHDETTTKTLRDGEKALKEFEKTLKNFGK